MKSMTDASSSLDPLSYAHEYDKMINWEKRLKRELPLLLEYLKPSLLLDLACASGRHSFALAKHGFTSVGIDIDPGFITLAQDLCKKEQASCKFFTYDLTNPSFPLFLREQGIKEHFDSALLLGNALAEMQGFQALQSLMKNITAVLKPGARVIVQTINRPFTPHYVALRKLGNYLHQRIMFPVQNQTHNVELHVNIIDPLTTKYIKKRVQPKFMLSTNEARNLFTEHKFKILETFSDYQKTPMSDEPGKSAIWVLEYNP